MRPVLWITPLMFLWLASAARAEKTQLEGVINLNTAPPDELRLVPGIGPARVRNILAYRRNHPFRTVEELARIKGIGRKTVRRWRQHLAVSGPSTAQKVVRPELPFVGPPAPPPPSQSRPTPPAPVRTKRPATRRGEPAHALSHHAPGNACLPPP
jgi:competence ComEA-like helix-hairpin-helix protein